MLNVDILQYFIQNLNLGNVVLKLKFIRFIRNFVHKSVFESAYNEPDITILMF